MLLHSFLVPQFSRNLTKKYHFEREKLFRVGSNLTVPNLHCRELDTTILASKFQAFKGGDDHVVGFIFGSVVLEKFIKEVPWWTGTMVDARRFFLSEVT